MSLDSWRFGPLHIFSAFVVFTSATPWRFELWVSPLFLVIGDGPQLRLDLYGLEALSEDGPLQRHAELQAELNFFRLIE